MHASNLIPHASSPRRDPAPRRKDFAKARRPAPGPSQLLAPDKRSGLTNENGRTWGPAQFVQIGSGADGSGTTWTPSGGSDGTQSPARVSASRPLPVRMRASSAAPAKRPLRTTCAFLGQRRAHRWSCASAGARTRADRGGRRSFYGRRPRNSVWRWCATRPSTDAIRRRGLGKRARPVGRGGERLEQLA
jgi:hypothetical protein